MMRAMMLSSCFGIVLANPLPIDDECAEGDTCALAALQRRATQAPEMPEVAEVEDQCYDAQPGDACYEHILAATDSSHPLWLPSVQQRAHDESPSVCPRPCSPKPSPRWCADTGATKLSAPKAGTNSTLIKVMSFNVFWWNLYGLRKGNDNSAGNLILDNMEVPFDAMGMQECEHGDWVLEPVGLLKTYAVVPGPHATCMAYNKASWKLISQGIADVSEDIPMRYYGKRGTQWMRLRHLDSGVHLFFINHHGPLSINSGGVCGGEATAHNILNVISENSEKGDVIALVGDFNANAGSLTIQSLWRSMVHTAVGPSFGGVDNIFTNVDEDFVVERKVLGSGGSDHEAISATFRIGGNKTTALKGSIPAAALAVNKMTGLTRPTHDWEHFWCGLMEMDMGYDLSNGAWSTVQNDPDRCCRECQAEPLCKAWVWRPSKQCEMSDSVPATKQKVDTVVSGLAYSAAAGEAKKAAAEAIRRV